MNPGATQDESQVLFYEKRLKEMPIRVLSSHGVIEKQGELVTLKIEKQSLQQRAELERIYDNILRDGENYTKLDIRKMVNLSWH